MRTNKNCNGDAQSGWPLLDWGPVCKKLLNQNSVYTVDTVLYLSCLVPSVFLCPPVSVNFSLPRLFYEFCWRPESAGREAPPHSPSPPGCCPPHWNRRDRRPDCHLTGGLGTQTRNRRRRRRRSLRTEEVVSILISAGLPETVRTTWGQILTLDWSLRKSPAWAQDSPQPPGNINNYQFEIFSRV